MTDAHSDILVINVGGSQVKLYFGKDEPVRFDSGKTLTARDLVQKTREACASAGSDVARISIGFPGMVNAGRPASEPINLGPGWIGVDFAAAFGKPVRMINDAALQALGSYEGGRLLFFGLGTGLGSTLITENVIVPIDLGAFRTETGQTFGEMLSKRGRCESGPQRWETMVFDLIASCHAAFSPDEVVLGGGLVERLGELPEGVRRGDNRHAYRGGVRLWESLDLKQNGSIRRWLIA